MVLECALKAIHPVCMILNGSYIMRFDSCRQMVDV